MLITATRYPLQINVVNPLPGEALGKFAGRIRSELLEKYE